MRGRYRNFPHTSLSSHTHKPPFYHIPHQNGRIVTTDEATGHIIVTQSPQFTLGFPLNGSVLVGHFMGLDKFWMTYIYHYSIIQSIFTALKNPHVPLIYVSLLANHLQALIFYFLFIYFFYWICRFCPSQKVI